jgi:hypothetical protein
MNQLGMAARNLFSVEIGADEMYNRLRNPASDAHERVLSGRKFSDELWARTADYLDGDLPVKAAQHFHQTFWEMYLAAALLNLGLPLIPRSERKDAGTGPDLQIAPNMWVEAIAVTAGSGPDAVQSIRELNIVHDVPDVPLRLRLVAGVDEKRKKFNSYLEKGIVAPTDICVVAINTGLLPIYSDLFPPRIVRALMEFGWPQIKIDRETRAVVERGHTHQPTVQKLSKSSVGQGMFLDGSCQSVSACLCSAASYAFAGYGLGNDFLVVHNPTALNPLQRRLINCGDECWTEGDELIYTRSDKTDG